MTLELRISSLFLSYRGSIVTSQLLLGREIGVNGIGIGISFFVTLMPIMANL